ncbi:MAG: type II toxin-antitoxin system prevent-host-death family antitoxin [Candidatus Saccharibacteria bacterium]|nr:type II toxin-antitoxin system prevent-host-death family antitoxin [Candidatus Saccharibacteria bacterium]
MSGTKLRQNLADITQVVANDTDVIITYRGVQKQVIMSLDRYEDLLASSNPKYL